MNISRLVINASSTQADEVQLVFRQTYVKKITLFHYTNEKTAWGDSVSFHHQSLPLALTECSYLLYQMTVWG